MPPTPPLLLRWLAALALLSCESALGDGSARFNRPNVSVTSMERFINVNVLRGGGVLGLLGGQVSVITSRTTLVRGVDFELYESDFLWEIGSSAPKAATLELFDSAFDSDQTEVISLGLEVIDGVTVPGYEELDVAIEPIAGMSLIEFLPALSSAPTFASEGSCLVYAKRRGSLRGPAKFYLEVEHCQGPLYRDSDAVATVDYTFDGQGTFNDFVWDDNEGGERCVLWQAVAGETTDINYIASVETLVNFRIDRRFLCLKPTVSSSIVDENQAISSLSGARLAFEIDEVTVFIDQGPKALTEGFLGTSNSCWKDRDCILDFSVGAAAARLYPGATIYLQDFDHIRFNCSDVSGPNATVDGFLSANFGVLRDEKPGYRSSIICLPDIEEAVVLGATELYGPFDSNSGECARGSSACSVTSPKGFYPTVQTDEYVLRIMTDCLNEESTIATLEETGILRESASSPGTHEVSSADVTTLAEVHSGSYELCWCRTSADGPDCELMAEFDMKVGLFVLKGPYRVRPDHHVFGMKPLVLTDIDGVGLRASDVASIQPACGAKHQTMRIATASTFGKDYDFGIIDVGDLPAAAYSLCWCQPEDGLECTQSEDFKAEFGDISIKCPSGMINEVGVCRPCKFFWQTPDETQTQCMISSSHFVDLIFALIFGSSVVLLVARLFEVRTRSIVVAGWDIPVPCSICVRRITIDDICPDGERIFVATLGRHHLLSYKGMIPVSLHDTGHRDLDAGRGNGERWCAIVRSKSRLELLERKTGKPPERRVDTSMGTLSLSLPRMCLHSNDLFRVPFIVIVPLMMCLVLIILTSSEGVDRDDMSLYFCVCFALGLCLRLLLIPTRLGHTFLAGKLELFNAKLSLQNPCPVPCEKGAGRAVTAFQLFELYDFFQACIKDRTMYYLDPNIVRPLCKFHKLSYAERAGPSRVDWFISHFWGTEFRVFCEAVRRHAITACNSIDEATWKQSAYWICTFSNNQYQIAHELGTTHEESSFYLALTSGHCQGTCMILDELAMPLTRSWCLFELLQTMTLEQVQADFKGLFFCTSTGVLNQGQATVELSMNIGNKLADLRLEMAEASDQKDKDMINDLVIKQMGSFDAINKALRVHIYGALEVCKSKVDDDFSTLFNKLEVANGIEHCSASAALGAAAAALAAGAGAAARALGGGGGAMSGAKGKLEGTEGAGADQATLLSAKRGESCGSTDVERVTIEVHQSPAP